MKRRILYLHVGDHVNGALESLLTLARALPADRYEVCIAATSADVVRKQMGDYPIAVRKAAWQPFGPLHEGYHLALARLPGWRRSAATAAAVLRLAAAYPGQRRLLRQLCAEFRPDVLHFNGFGLIAAGAAARGLGIPQVWHVRAMFGPGVWGRWAGRTIPRLADAVATISEGVAAQLDPACGNLHLVYDGFDLTRFAPSISGEGVRAAWGIPPSAPCVGFVGRLLAAKGVFDLLEAAPAILSTAPDAHFLLVGGGSEVVETQLRERIRALGLQERLHLTGQCSDVPELLAAMDVFVQPSWSEGLGRVVVEAMAMGKPVVATRLAGVQGVLIQGRNASLVEPQRPDEIARAALDFLREPKQARACGQQARQDALERFSLQAYGERMTALYDDLCQKKRGQGTALT